MNDMVLLYEFRNILLHLENVTEEHLLGIQKLLKKVDELINRKKEEVSKNG